MAYATRHDEELRRALRAKVALQDLSFFFAAQKARAIDCKK
jgi:hypothetical protein